MENYYKIFNEYVKKYNLREPMIRLKFHHSYRVMEFCKEIAESLELSEEDIKIASVAGLFHDIGRFNQWEKYKTYEDSKSIDHGDEGYNILKENDFIDKTIKDIILNTTKSHNKYKLDNSLDEKTKLFCNIVRDADKLDIIVEQNNTVKEDKIELKQEILNSIYNETIVENKLVKNDVDSIIRMLSWVYDLNFKYSYNFLLENRVLDKKFELLEIYGETEELTKLKETILNKLKEMC